jgi:hypothetical protein
MKKEGLHVRRTMMDVKRCEGAPEEAAANADIQKTGVRFGNLQARMNREILRS